MKALAALVALTSVLAACACGDDPARRVGTVFSWKRDGSPASIARIRGLLSDPDPGVRAAAVDALTSNATPDAMASALAALDDADASVRAVAAKGLGELREPSVVPRLIQLLQDDQVAQVRRRAAEALELLGGDDAAATLAESLSDPSREVRLAATRGCARLQSADCFESLARVILDDPEWEIRVAAARGLGDSGRAEAEGALRSATGDPNEFVRAAAATALATLLHDIASEEASPPAADGHRSGLPVGVYSGLRHATVDAPTRRSESDRASD